ncbi:VOC family protein [Micromonospora cathayae]|uniref:VOC family protein n=1 Tax=Micromonospora cathayae TaxID=3028804 RepID=A0ABY7ZGK6_9ACTN|nr:VOC family protein [Micromonospora sp. HUAS 3]WDZ82130.1 VOC family protein [Micromonospora sp. HUAS 3]
MADELTVPLLPCRSIDDITGFYRVLGFTVTHRQTRPNPYVALRREDLHLHFFGMPDFDPATSYGSCLVLVPDVGALHAAWAAGMRAAYGKVLVAGLPRMTRPRPRHNADGVTGFSVVDPGGNWIRVSARPSSVPSGASTGPTGRLATALGNAVVQADSRGDHRQAAKILDGALARPDALEEPVLAVEALVYRAEIALVLDDAAAARAALDRAGAVTLSAAQRRRAADTLDAATELGRQVGRPDRAGDG